MTDVENVYNALRIYGEGSEITMLTDDQAQRTPQGRPGRER